MTKRQFGELETAILRVFNNSTKPLTVKDVLQALQADDKYTTVMTVMSRLAEKGVLLRKREGLQYHYSVNPKQEMTSHTLMGRMKEKLFSGKSFAMISFLLESSDDISDEELQKIQQLIKKKKR